MKKILLIGLALSLWLNGGIVDMHNSSKLRIGIKYDTKPFGFKDGKSIKGFDLDLSKLIVAQIKEKVKLPNLKVFYKKVYPSNREAMLENKKVDMVIATYTITQERMKRVSYSKPYFKTAGVIVFRGELSEGETVGVLNGSSTESAVIAKEYKVKTYPNYREMFSDFDKDGISAIASDKVILQKYENSGHFASVPLGDNKEYGIGLPKDNSAFQELINSILNDLKKSGELDILKDKWFGVGARQ